MRLTAFFVVLIFGFSLGWWSHQQFHSQGLLDSSPPELYAPPFSLGGADDKASDDQHAKHSLVVEKSTFSSKSSSAPYEDKSDERIDLLVVLEKHINDLRFEEAVGLYQKSLESQPLVAARIKEALLTYMRLFLSHNDSSLFSELVQSYLQVFYDDIDVLLILVEHHRNAEYYFEALDVYQLSREYAYSPESRARVRKSFEEFLGKIDAHLRESGLGYMLAQLYQHADGMRLLDPQQRLRLAEVYLENQEIYFAKQVLNELALSGPLKQVARERLLLLDGGNETTVLKNTAASFETRVQLISHGESHYLAELYLDNSSPLRLLIDTGASTTTVTQEAFDRIAYQVSSEFLGNRMFRTANGIASAQIKRLSSISLGPYELQNKKIAVMDFEMASGIDGLLGMNVLNHFIFQIDPNDPALLLSPR